jgi:hypothetical protein
MLVTAKTLPQPHTRGHELMTVGRGYSVAEALFGWSNVEMLKLSSRRQPASHPPARHALRGHALSRDASATARLQSAVAALSLLAMDEADQVLDQFDHDGHDDRCDDCGCHGWPCRRTELGRRPHALIGLLLVKRPMSPILKERDVGGEVDYGGLPRESRCNVVGGRGRMVAIWASS